MLGKRLQIGALAGIGKTAHGRLRRAFRSATPGRLIYEGVLTVTVATLTVIWSIFLDDAPVAVVALLALGALALLPLRVFHPTGTLLTAAAAAGALTGGAPEMLLFVLSLSAGYRMRSLPRASVAFGAVLCADLAGLWWHSGHDAAAVVLRIGQFLVLDLLPAMVAQMVSQRRQLIEMMHERNVHLHGQQAIIAERARARERDRIARELHDSLGNRLTLISIYAGALEVTAGPDRNTAFDLLRTTSATAMAELRQILGILHENAGADEQSGENLSLDGVPDLIEATRSAGASVTLTRQGTSRPLPPIVEHAAYRTVQEGLTNALRHARGAAVQVTVRFETKALVAEVWSGPGAPHDGPTSGQGLIGLAERIRLAGGTLRHGTGPDCGFRLAATLPLTEPEVVRRHRSGPPVPYDPAGDPIHPVRHSRRRARLWTMAFGGGVLLVLVLCGGWVTLLVESMTISRQTYDTIQLGQREEEVRRMLGEAALDTPGPGAPAVPPGATCADYNATPAVPFDDFETMYRFCFQDGTLIAKVRYTGSGG